MDVNGKILGGAHRRRDAESGQLAKKVTMMQKGRDESESEGQIEGEARGGVAKERRSQCLECKTMEGRSFAIGANVPSLKLALVYTVAARHEFQGSSALSKLQLPRGRFFFSLLHPTRNTNRTLASAIEKSRGEEKENKNEGIIWKKSKNWVEWASNCSGKELLERVIGCPYAHLDSSFAAR